MDVLVVGGGVIGLLSAWYLAQTGHEVTLLERSGTGLEASWAGGGIVSPLYPWRYSAAVSSLAHWSQDFYPSFGEQLLRTTGIDPEVHVTGLYWLDLDDHDLALRWAAEMQRPLYSVPVGEVFSLLPALSCRFSQALWMPGIANVRNPQLLKALRAALVEMPQVTICEQSEVLGFLTKAGRVDGVRTQDGELFARRTLIAAGAWSGDLLVTLGLDLPVEPVKGQMILFKCDKDFLPSMVLAKGRYAIPRRDGHILVGSTLEHKGFDKTPTESALESLRASAIEMLPALADAEVVGHWAGLRPGSPDGIPFIGPVPGFDGLWLNCGHYRNGLVLAPASCRLLTDLMLGREPIVDPTPYAPSARLKPLA